MEVKDRIQNIKALLKYCPIASDEVMLYDKELRKFFWNFFSKNKDRFKRPAYDNDTLVQIELHAITDNNDEYINNTISMRYCYFDKDSNENWSLYLFNDPDCNLENWQTIEYSEIPDYIWEKIQNILYDKAGEWVNQKLELAKSCLTYWENKKESFDNLSLK